MSKYVSSWIVFRRKLISLSNSLYKDSIIYAVAANTYHISLSSHFQAANGYLASGQESQSGCEVGSVILRLCWYVRYLNSYITYSVVV